MTATKKRDGLLAELGMEIVRFQDASNAFDDAAAAVLALDRIDLQLVAMLLFGGAAPLPRLAAAAHAAPAALRARIERLELAGYVRAAAEDSFELTDHARTWIATIWGPMEREGRRLLARQTTRHLELFLRLMREMRPIHEAHAARVRALLELPRSERRSRVAKGGLSPAALRRVQLYVEANLSGEIQIADLASRAGLSTFHFARAFRSSTGTTPRKYVEQQRIERARRLLVESDLALAQIAMDCGLGSQSRFTTVFRRATGLTPAIVRRDKRQ
jgi:AraC family transcriptional regulator